MPFGRYPERIKDFQKWSKDMVSKGTITNRATASRARKRSFSKHRRRRRRRNRWLLWRS